MYVEISTSWFSAVVCWWSSIPRSSARRAHDERRFADQLLRGDAVEVLLDAFARVPADALPVVTTT